MGTKSPLKILLATLLATSVAAISSNAFADEAHLKALCYKLDQDGQPIEGTNTESRVEIGSVSKIFTSYWAITVRSPSYRFETLVHVHQLANGTWNVHLQGSRDPYFGRSSLQFIMASLNQLGIKKIHNLTFDENLKYYAQPIDQHVLVLKTYEPSPSTVRSNLETSMDAISSGYTTLAASLKSRYNLAVPSTLSMTYDTISYLSHQDMLNSVVAPTLAYSFKSAPLLTLIKEMNRNSNNYAANNIFESMGGRAEFKKFISANMGFTTDDVLMLNGSGDHFYEDDSLGHYNEATCDAILKLLHTFRANLKAMDLYLPDVMAVVGEDAGATANIYENDLTRDAVVAKTGTVDPGVALAGLASTKDGVFLFASVFGPGDTSSSRSSGHEQIESHLTSLIRSHGGASKISYESKSFSPLDQGSALTEVVSADNSNAAPLKVGNAP